MTTTSRTTTSRASPLPHDAIVMLMDDHQRVKALFKNYEKVKEDATADEKLALVTAVCNELTVHAEVEEAIFYPAAREAMDDAELLDEAEVEHASAKDLISQLGAMRPEDSLYDAKVKVLGEYIDHHVKEEESEMFPKAKKSKLDTAALGEEMAMRKDELKKELGLDEGDAEKPEGETPRAIARKSGAKAKPKA